MERIIYIGMNVHKDTNTAHMFGRLDDIVIDYEIGTIASKANHLIKAIRFPSIRKPRNPLQKTSL